MGSHVQKIRGVREFSCFIKELKLKNSILVVNFIAIFKRSNKYLHAIASFENDLLNFFTLYPGPRTGKGAHHDSRHQAAETSVQSVYPINAMMSQSASNHSNILTLSLNICNFAT
jgi:hypothetical protein